MEKATPGNFVFIFFSWECEVGKSSEKRVNPIRQNLDSKSLFLECFFVIFTCK